MRGEIKSKAIEMIAYCRRCGKQIINSKYKKPLLCNDCSLESHRKAQRENIIKLIIKVRCHNG